MFGNDVCLGTTCGIEKSRALSDALNAKVLNQLNGSQELIMHTEFARESNEYQFKKSLQDRISDIASWHWVLEDLSKRLDESIDALKYEHNALRVVVRRVQEEMEARSREATRPGAICPLMDIVEETVIDEFNFLREQKKNFENLIYELEKKIVTVEKTKSKIDADVLNKQKTLTIEGACANKDYKHAILVARNKRQKGSPIARWVKRCAALKRCGLKALFNAVNTRQQVRGARVRLSIDSQALAAKVDAALRRRLHTNKLKLQELNWQKEEAVRDYNSLQDELVLAEMAVVEIIDQERTAAARLADRDDRPARELTKDDLNRSLRDEQYQLRVLTKELRHNIDDIIALQNNLYEAIADINCCVEDLMYVIGLDEDRTNCRQGKANHSTTSTASSTNTNSRDMAKPSQSYSQQPEQLTVIREENEDDVDDYPFDF